MIDDCMGSCIPQVNKHRHAGCEMPPKGTIRARVILQILHKDASCHGPTALRMCNMQRPLCRGDNREALHFLLVKRTRCTCHYSAALAENRIYRMHDLLKQNWWFHWRIMTAKSVGVARYCLHTSCGVMKCQHNQWSQVTYRLTCRNIIPKGTGWRPDACMG